jgi:hypothetical protein
MRARRTALGLSAVAVFFSLVFGILLRRWLGFPHPDEEPLALAGALSFLLVALLLRIIASIFELLWLERTWGNLPEDLRRVGPIDKVEPVMVIGFAFVPVLAWFWKLALIAGIANGFETVRTRVPFTAPVPKGLGVAAAMMGWIPGLNIYIAPFLWEMFARKIDRVCVELGAPPG